MSVRQADPNDDRQHTMFSITFNEKKESILLSVDADGNGTATMTGKVDSRVHIYGTPGVHYAIADPVAFTCTATASILWAAVGKHGIYDNRRITLTRKEEGGLSVAITPGCNADVSLFETTVAADVPVVCKLYRYGGELRVRKE